ncbi:MAG: hypothetical protein IJD92_01645 [Bacilli bacterium]|nr:hypothetical protein [Bacilli bacterium]
MEDLFKNIYSISKNQKIIDENIIINLLKSLVDYYSLNEYVESINITNYKDNNLANYNINKKTININFQKMILYIINNLPENINEPKIKFLLVNLQILKILLHELEHVNQERKIRLNNDLETKIYLRVQDWEYAIKDKNLDYYNRILYNINPMERQANIVSIKKILKFIGLTDNIKIKNYFKNDYLFTIIKNYNIETSKYPLILYFNKYPYLREMKSLIYKTNHIFDQDLRGELGLKLSIKEYNNLKYKD